MYGADRFPGRIGPFFRWTELGTAGRAGRIAPFAATVVVPRSAGCDDATIKPVPAGFAWTGTAADAARSPIRSASASSAGSCTTATPEPSGLRTRPARCWTTWVSSWPRSCWPWVDCGLYWPGAK